MSGLLAMGTLLGAGVRLRRGELDFSLSLLPHDKTRESYLMASVHPGRKMQGSGVRYFCT